MIIFHQLNRHPNLPLKKGGVTQIVNIYVIRYIALLNKRSYDEIFEY